MFIYYIYNKIVVKLSSYFKALRVMKLEKNYAKKFELYNFDINAAY